MRLAALRLLALAVVVAVVGLVVHVVLNTTGWFAGSSITYTGYHGTALVSTDGRTVTVGGFSRPCFGTVSLVAEEAPGRVALRLRWKAPGHHGTCTAAMSLVVAMNVRLAAPLGARALVDPDTGTAVPRFDESGLLHPAWLPAGYALSGIRPGTVKSGPPQDWRSECQESYRSAIGPEIVVIQALGTAPAFRQIRPTAVRVRGTQGWADARSVQWTEKGQTIVVEDYSEADEFVAGPSTSDLVRIADSSPRAP